MSSPANIIKFLSGLGILRDLKQAQTDVTTLKAASTSTTQALATLVPATVTFSATWDMTGAKDYGVQVISAPVILLSTDTGSINGGFSQADFVTDGVHTPTMDGVAPVGWPSSAGQYVQVRLQRRGPNKYWNFLLISHYAVIGAPTPAPAPTPTPAPAPSPTPAPAPTPISSAPLSKSGAKQFTLTAPATGNHPFTLGYAFAQGDFPASAIIAADKVTNLQVQRLNAWPDGSAKFAVLSGIASLQAATPLKVTLASGAAPAVSAVLTTTDLKATGITASITPTGLQDWSWDTAAQNVGSLISIGPLDVYEAGAGTDVYGNAVAGSTLSGIYVDSGAVVSNYAHTNTSGNVAQTATISGGTDDSRQTMQTILQYHTVRQFSSATNATNCRLGLVLQTGYKVGQHIQLSNFVGGMTELNGQTGVVTAVDLSNSQWIEVNIDSTGYSAYSSGGQGYRNELDTNYAYTTAYVRTGGGIEWNGAVMVYKSTNAMPLAGAVSWATTDWDTPFVTQVSGQQMSSWIYRKQLGTHRHLVAWLEVRLYIDGSVEVLPWIENGYIRVLAPNTVKGTWDFTLNGTSRSSQVIEIHSRTRTPLVTGAALSYWLGTDPAVNIRHDTTYLQNTEVVPSYMAVVDPASSLVTNMPATFTPFQQGGFDYSQDAMESTGFASPIGLLPQHDVIYLTSTAPSLYGAVQRNGFSAGRYPIHYRDEVTNRPLKFSDYPHLSSNSSSTGDVPRLTTTYVPGPDWDTAHHPSVGYLAYLLTGRYYFMEEVQFAATANYIGQTDTARGLALGYMEPLTGAVQTREVAWMMRTLMTALMVTPDGDASGLQTEFINSWVNIANRYHAQYVEQPNNPLGFVANNLDYSTQYSDAGRLAAATGYMAASWMHDFMVAVFGWAAAAQMPIGTTAQGKLLDFFVNFISKSVVGRLGATNTGTDYLFSECAPYNMCVSANHTPDWIGGTGPWLANWNQAYQITKNVAASFGLPTPFTEDPSTIHEISMPPSGGYVANMLPALAYCIRHNVPGAADGLARLKGAIGWSVTQVGFNTNWNVVDSFNQISPVWSVTSAVQPLPSWVTALAQFEWGTIPNSTQAGSAFDAAGGGLAANSRLSYSSFTVYGTEIWLLATGGHSDYSGNEVGSIDLGVSAPAWQLRHARSSTISQDVAYEPDGTPAAAHRYWGGWWSKETGRLMQTHTRFTWPNASVSTGATNGFDPLTNTWDAAGTWTDVPLCDCMDEDGTLWFIGDGGFNIGKFVPSTNTVTVLHTTSVACTASPTAFDSRRKFLYSLCIDDGQNLTSFTLNSFTVDRATGLPTPITFNTSAAFTQFMARRPVYMGMDYDPVNDCYLAFTPYSSLDAYAGGDPTVYKIIPNATTVWDMVILSVTGPVPASTTMAMARWKYVPALGGFVCMPSGLDPMSFLRTAVATPPAPSPSPAPAPTPTPAPAPTPAPTPAPAPAPTPAPAPSAPAGTKIQMATLGTAVVETGDASNGWNYTAPSILVCTDPSGTQNAVSSVFIAASGDLTVVIGAITKPVNDSAGVWMLNVALDAASTNVGDSSQPPYAVLVNSIAVHDTGNFMEYKSLTAPFTALNGTFVTPAAGDWLQFRVAAGTGQVTAYVSKDQGTSWTLIHTFATAAVLPLYAHVQPSQWCAALDIVGNGFSVQAPPPPAPAPAPAPTPAPAPAPTPAPAPAPAPAPSADPDLVFLAKLTDNGLVDAVSGLPITAHGTAAFVSGAPGPAYQLGGGSANYLSAANMPALTLPLTIGTFYRQKAATNIGSGLQIVGLNIDNGTKFLSILLDGSYALNAVARNYSTTASLAKLTTSGFAYDTWQMVAGVFASSTSRAVYSQGQGLSAVDTTAVDTSGSSATLVIAEHPVDGSLSLDGYEKYVFVYKRALTQAELDARAADPTLIF